jgi:hypothetical protein
LTRKVVGVFVRFSPLPFNVSSPTVDLNTLKCAFPLAAIWANVMAKFAFPDSSLS